MAEPSDQRRSPYQLPPLQQPPRILMPASIPGFSDSQPSESVGSLSPVDSSHGGFGKSRSSPPVSHRDGARDRRISAACTACKKRKSKCTGGPPPCKLCRIAGIECVINESLDGRRKLAAKRVQDELQQHKALLEGLLEGLRSPERTDKILDLIRQRVSLALLSDHVLQPPTTIHYESRTRVPIELLIEAEEVLSQRTTSKEYRRSDDFSGSPSSRQGISPPASTHIGLKLRPSGSYPGPQDDSHNYQEFVQTLHGCSEQVAVYLVQELRRVGDVSTFLQKFSKGNALSHGTGSSNHMT